MGHLLYQYSGPRLINQDIDLLYHPIHTHGVILRENPRSPSLPITKDIMGDNFYTPRCTLRGYLVCSIQERKASVYLRITPVPSYPSIIRPRRGKFVDTSGLCPLCNRRKESSIDLCAPIWSSPYYTLYPLNLSTYNNTWEVHILTVRKLEAVFLQPVRKYNNVNEYVRECLFFIPP